MFNYHNIFTVFYEVNFYSYNPNRFRNQNAKMRSRIFKSKEEAKNFIKNFVNANGYTLCDVVDGCGKKITL